MNDEVLRDAFTAWEELSSTRDGMLAYRSRLKQIMDEESVIREAELREQAALVRGLEEGMEKGVEKVAKKMIAKGKSNEEIMGDTDLTIEEVEALRAEG